MDYKALAIKFAVMTFDRSTGYQADKNHEFKRVACMECDAEADGIDRMKLVHEADCDIKEIQQFMQAHGVIAHPPQKEQNGKLH